MYFFKKFEPKLLAYKIFISYISTRLQIAKLLKSSDAKSLA